MTPQTKYARSSDIHIAYQVVGEGPLDVVEVPGLVGHLDLLWEIPVRAHSYRRYASFARLIRFDKRGTGLSDRMESIGSLEDRVDDVRAVMDAVGSERAALVGISEGGPMSILFAATHPDRTSALILVDSFARIKQAPDYPWGTADEALRRLREITSQTWGNGTIISLFFPTLKGDERWRDVLARVEQYSASPGAVLSILEMIGEIDVRPVLPTLSVPTLILHRERDPMVSVECGRYLARTIPGARYVELSGTDHLAVEESQADLEIDEIEEFLTGVRHGPDPDRALTTVVFTDIVSSSERAAELGDRKWREVLDSHNALIRRALERFRGREVKTTGDGFLATFDGPARAIRCASAIRDGVRGLGIEIRAGVHTGECEVLGEDIGGIAVHIGARVAAMAGNGEILVSRTVKDLVAGSGIEFEDRGTRSLKGIPEEWQLFAVRQ